MQLYPAKELVFYFYNYCGNTGGEQQDPFGQITKQIYKLQRS
jgi:hypothetical protein